uniref:HIT domain-containing protein n=1 Tax=Cucumis melo TaxID=3656 RepID=A0A9I9D6Z5_CUCME
MVLRFQASRALLPLTPSSFLKFCPSSIQLGFTSISSSPTKSFTIMAASDHYTFGRYKIDPKEVFYCTTLSYAMVNLRPLLPGQMANVTDTQIFGLQGPISINCLKLTDRSYPFRCTIYWKILGGACMMIIEECRSFIKRFIMTLELEPTLIMRFADLTADETCDLWLAAQRVGQKLELYHKASSLTFAIQDGPQAGQTVPHVHIHVLPRKGGDFEKNDEIYDALDEKEKELKQHLDLDKERKDRNMEEMAEEADQYRKLLL